MDKTSEIDTIYGKEKLKVTCVERKYKIISPRVTYLITAKKELDKDITERLLHEDMELKTFLTYYEITNVKFPVSNSENVNLTKIKIPEDIEKIKIPEDIEKIKIPKDIEKIKIPKDIEKIKIPKGKPTSVRDKTLARRELYDLLDLPEKFVIKDYREAIEKQGIKITNTAMPYDDLEWLEKKGKVIKLGKSENNKVTYMKAKKTEINDITDRMDIDTNQSLKEGQKALMRTIRDSQSY